MYHILECITLRQIQLNASKFINMWVERMSSFKKFSAYIWGNPQAAETWARISLPYSKIGQILAAKKAQKKPTTVTAIVTCLIGKVIEKHPELRTFVVGRKIVNHSKKRIFITTYFKSDHHVGNNSWDLSGIHLDHCHLKSIQEITDEIRQKSRQIKTRQDPQINRFSKLIKACPYWLLSLIYPMVRYLIFRREIPVEKVGLPGDRFGNVIITALHEFGIETAKIPIHNFCNASLIIAICAPYWRLTETGKEKRLPLDITIDHRIIDGKAGALIMKTLNDELEQELKKSKHLIQKYAEYH